MRRKYTFKFTEKEQKRARERLEIEKKKAEFAKKYFPRKKIVIYGEKGPREFIFAKRSRKNYSRKNYLRTYQYPEGHFLLPEMANRYFIIGLEAAGLSPKQAVQIALENKNYLRREARSRRKCIFDIFELGEAIGDKIIEEKNKGRKMPRVVSESK